jgi:hypothetical protein
MIAGIDRSEVLEFTTSDDKGDPKTVFLVGNITNRQKMAVLADVLDQNGQFDAKKMQEKTIDIVKIGLKGIRNIYSPDAQKVVDIEAIDDAELDNIPFGALLEVAAKIVEKNFAGAGQLKNS